MGTTVDCCTTQLIDGDGGFDVTGLNNFIETSKMSSCGISYAVVAIMGPQSSGKSTLMNHLFHTNFREMDALRARSQTTKGIWIAKCNGIEPCTIAMDLEGTDGRERGEDDTTFEKQSALFALAVSDIVLINMWCHDIGREQAASKPLLRTVFQVMMRLFSPRKITLLFVIRDKTKTPLEILEPILREDIQKIWDEVPKPQAHVKTPVSDFFTVEVTALSSYEFNEDKFKEEVAKLRQRFYNSVAPGGLAGDRRGAVPATGFSISAQEIWKAIRENKDLDLPAHKVMVATVRCEAIADEKLNQLGSDKDWLDLEHAVQLGPVQGFGEKLSSIIDTYLSLYDEETIYFDEAVRNAKRKQLESNVLNIVCPAYATMIKHLRSKALEVFKTELDESLNKGQGFTSSVQTCFQSILHEFDKGCIDASVRQANWDASKAREKLSGAIYSHVLFVHTEKLSEITTNSKKQLAKALDKPLESLFEAGGKDTWHSIRKLVKRETEAAVSELSDRVAGFELEEEVVENMQQSLRYYARKLVDNKAREEAKKVLSLMKDRFSTVFNLDNNSLPRVWTRNVDINAITRDARYASLKLLSDLAAIRLDENPDNIERILDLSLIKKNSAATSYHPNKAEDSLASSTWEEVSPRNTLISPVQCKSLWRQFIAETMNTIAQAQEAYKRNNRNRNSKWFPHALQTLQTAAAVATVGYTVYDQLNDDHGDNDPNSVDHDLNDPNYDAHDPPNYDDHGDNGPNFVDHDLNDPNYDAHHDPPNYDDHGDNGPNFVDHDLNDPLNYDAHHDPPNYDDHGDNDPNFVDHDLNDPNYDDYDHDDHDYVDQNDLDQYL